MSESSIDSNALAGKTIVLGVSGSIAAYKAADLTSELRRLGADVFVVMTRAAKEFIGPITLQTLSRLTEISQRLNHTSVQQAIKEMPYEV